MCSTTTGLGMWVGGGADLCIHVSTIHVHLASILVDDAADFVNALLVHSVG